MHEFATILLLGLAVYAVVSLVRHYVEVPGGAQIFLSLLLGALLTWATDYSVFAGWGIRFRSLWMGPVATGLVIGGIALVWREVLELLSARAGRPAEARTADEARVARERAA
jgi:hypothetical protein